jgi:hypothetical protein
MTEQYVAWYRDPRTGANVRVYVSADSYPAAQSLFEAQYGSSNIWGVGKA